jgi:hypothetical protein
MPSLLRSEITNAAMRSASAVSDESASEPGWRPPAPVENTVGESARWKDQCVRDPGRFVAGLGQDVATLHHPARGHVDRDHGDLGGRDSENAR